MELLIMSSYYVRSILQNYLLHNQTQTICANMGGVVTY
jgi:hypothetical protein